eukprot:TRINITY_DN855_c0_g1_i4.p1 TRINITY_DN855_c0_g1~~TRINITY_DN855_c0_g1_i4.p1  ORF type:complete len:273 (+),score=35.70 TRINITY_DN855_c0_g1_i4:90-908(+)
MALLLSQGVPMLIMGDEYGHSKGGNNNTYCHDSMLNWFNWDKAERDPTGIRRFMRHLIRFRRSRRQLKQKYYIQAPGIVFHGAADPDSPDWSDSSRFVAFSLKGGKGETTLYIAFNSAHTPQPVCLPSLGGQRWKLIIDTGKPAPFDFLQEDASLSKEEIQQVYYNVSMWTDNDSYPMLPWSAIMLESIPQDFKITDQWIFRQKSWTTPKQENVNLIPTQDSEQQSKSQDDIQVKRVSEMVYQSKDEEAAVEAALEENRKLRQKLGLNPRNE